MSIELAEGKENKTKETKQSKESGQRVEHLVEGESSGGGQLFLLLLVRVRVVLVTLEPLEQYRDGLEMRMSAINKFSVGVGQYSSYDVLVE